VREIAPTVFTAVPRVWEKFYSGVMIALKEASALQQAAYAWAIGVGTQIAEQGAGRAAGGRGLKFQFTLARWLALNNVRKLIGIHRARFLRDRRGAHLARTGEAGTWRWASRCWRSGA
jgi:long-chain acyl-CoA synthetase